LDKLELFVGGVEERLSKPIPDTASIASTVSSLSYDLSAFQETRKKHIDDWNLLMGQNNCASNQINSLSGISFPTDEKSYANECDEAVMRYSPENYSTKQSKCLSNGNIISLEEGRQALAKEPHKYEKPQRKENTEQRSISAPVIKSPPEPAKVPIRSLKSTHSIETMETKDLIIRPESRPSSVMSRLSIGRSIQKGSIEDWTPSSCSSRK